MPYVMKDASGNIKAVSLNEVPPSGHWIEVGEDATEYLQFLETAMAKVDPFRESDIHFVRVLEDLINVLIERDVMRFTDLPEAARKRLLQRQAMRSKTTLSNIVDENQELPV